VNNGRDSKRCRDAGNSRIASDVPPFEFTVGVGASLPAGDMKSGFNAKKYAADCNDGPIAWVGTDKRIFQQAALKRRGVRLP
jgi:hypothetical protein